MKSRTLRLLHSTGLQIMIPDGICRTGRFRRNFLPFISLLYFGNSLAADEAIATGYIALISKLGEILFCREQPTIYRIHSFYQTLHNRKSDLGLFRPVFVNPPSKASCCIQIAIH